jgi:HEAT repeat protein
VSTPELVNRAEALGVKVNGAPEHLPEVLPELLDMLEANRDVEVLTAVIEALGQAWSEAACLAVIPYATHPDRNVRLAAVRTMAAGVDSSEGTATVASVLIDRSHDADTEIRDWATTELGSILDFDSTELRDALRTNLDDSNYDVQCEALVGLAKRRDASAFEATLRLLGNKSVGRLVVEAAELLGDSRLFESLNRLSEWWDVDPELLDRAVAACSPTTP